jgi:WD40 repeat protein
MKNIIRKYPNHLLFILLAALCLQGCNSGPDPEKSWVPETDGILSADISSSGRYVLLGTDKGKANLWDLEKKLQLQHSWQHQDEDPDGISAVALSADGRFALTANNKSLAWWNLKDGRVMGYWRLEDIKSVSLSKDGRYALIGFKNSAEYFSLERSQKIHTFAHPDNVKTSAISEDGRFAITGSDNLEARLWSLKNGELLYTWKYRTKLKSVALSPDGEYAMTNAVLGETRIWKTKTGKLVQKLPPKRVTITAVDFDAKSKKLIIARARQRIDLWSINSGEISKSLIPKKSDDWRPSSAVVIALRFTAKDKKIVSVTSNGIVERWSAK